jgi:hypothetical protein
MREHWYAFNLIETNVLHLCSVHTVAFRNVNTNYTNVTLIGIYLITAPHEIIFVIPGYSAQQRGLQPD